MTSGVGETSGVGKTCGVGETSGVGMTTGVGECQYHKINIYIYPNITLPCHSFA
jgi:hypothetical protein